MLLHRQDVPSALSPYRVSTNYRRPPGGDSDHGYSTMTPHDDSEHLPCAEPLLLGKDFHQLSSPHTDGSVASPSSSQTAQLTQLDGLCHRVLAPVTVHMVDTL